jgi:hypothetical protein
VNHGPTLSLRGLGAKGRVTGAGPNLQTAAHNPGMRRTPTSSPVAHCTHTLIHAQRHAPEVLSAALKERLRLEG